MREKLYGVPSARLRIVNGTECHLNHLVRIFFFNEFSPALTGHRLQAAQPASSVKAAFSSLLSFLLHHVMYEPNIPRISHHVLCSFALDISRAYSPFGANE